MHYKFAVTNKGRIALIGDGKVICPIEDMAGYETIRMMIIDTIVDNMTDTLTENGVSVDKETLKTVKKNTTNRKFSFNNIVEMLIASTLLITWMMGIVLAKGFWLTTLAMFFPFYSWYLVSLMAMTKLNFI